MRAIFSGTVIAESHDTVVVEGNHYFPPSSVNTEYLSAPTGHSTHCPWKGDASHHDVVVGDQSASNAAWFYAEPFEKATSIKDHVAFYPVVTIIG